ncbi:ectonucleotide pyrophosphatase/phosphodiesterase [Maribacter sp. HTCC2170]|uniref:alkaline phosphatase family protein n=1 Tax=Maribacter sp. (strain HTCC2170 / KCCM 42371) TaxID=313603 RepID=UPI00006B475C|nr:ectonucleotide pyrophosphatase/phosphodiesterase [Maribacter sp. HTCC2170]EAR01652.1 RB13-6 antigen [Maribacter sp. HTCC2170]
MVKTIFKRVLTLVIATLVFSSCKSKTSVVDSKPTTNSKTAIEKPYLVLISLDGFRWDYVERYNPPNLSNFIKNGVQAESLISSFPSKTFPNHYTIVTGMYPDNHGILGNSFYSNEKDVTYKIGNREMVEDGSFYGGSPIWVQADKANMVSASYFFVGSEADVQGIRPTYYHTYDGSIKNNVRVEEALKWLALPEKKRPHLITMYFSDMDDVGHDFGPNNDEKLKKALFDLDNHLGNLFKGAAKTGLPINFLVVSDHGMSALSTSKYIAVEDIMNTSLYSTINNGAIVNVHPKKDVSTDSVYNYLKAKEHNFKIYKTENTPGFEYNPKNKNWGTIQVIPDFGYYFSKKQKIEALKNLPITTVGVHGYDPVHKDMHGIFYANGPAFKKGYALPSIKNIHIYPLMCRILDLEIPSNIDGKIEELEVILKTNYEQ